jgi:predicted nucleotidyltransferase
MDAASWSVTPEKIREVVDRLVATGIPRMIVLFGSAARGTTHRDSDIDLLVVVADEVENTRAERARLRRALRGAAVPVDLVVVREGRLRALADEPGLIYEEALSTGETLYAAA